METDNSFKSLSNAWLIDAGRKNYLHKLTWFGRPIIQLPTDSYAIQEIVWSIRPDLIIETGVAHGGSLIYSASMLALLDYVDAVTQGYTIEPLKSKRKVIGIDIDIREHNRVEIEKHPFSYLISLIEGDSVSPTVIKQVKSLSKSYKTILVMLDSNHTHNHVLDELKVYAPLVSVNSYCIVWDTSIEDMPDTFFRDRPWGKGNNPRTAINEYLKTTKKFKRDFEISSRLLITASPDGFLKRIK